MLLRARPGALLLFCAIAATTAAATPVFGPSGRPVPRFESLKYGEVNGRVGPSLDHRVLWSYHRRGLPVEIIAESDQWRQVADPDGATSWIQAARLAARRTAFVSSPTAVALRRAPKLAAAPVALLGHGVVAALEECRGGWRKLRVGDHRGWAPVASLWGADRCETPSPG